MSMFPPQHFVRKIAQKLAARNRRRVEPAPNQSGLGLTGSVKAKVIYRRIHNPGDFRLPGLFLALADQFFIAGRG